MSETDFLYYNAIYADGHFEREKLGALINKGGAAGKIYQDVTNPHLVAKIFHDRNKSYTNRQKLEAMLHNRPNIPMQQCDGKDYVQIAWPEAVLEDDEGFCVGYLMPLINTDEAVSLDHLMQKAVRQRLGLSEKYANRLYAAYNVASMVAALHTCGHYIVDLKPANVSVYKDKMLVAMFDCDGFSIKGEKGRYPAEYVSEEYIYPEGMTQTCEEMGEEQDKFALAVILFKLLNNGIHPFSGIPHKQTDEMLTIQDRIEKYHYAYGLFPDSYQDPNPYSIHNYFDPKTLELFDRAFVKGKKRPTAKEWMLHLEYLFTKIKECKKNPDHIYFTNKGCGLCAVEEKFKQDVAAIKQEKAMPAKIRGIEVSELSTEANEKIKKENEEKLLRLTKIVWAAVIAYLVFFSLISFMLAPLKPLLVKCGYAVQLLMIVILLKELFVLIDYVRVKQSVLKNTAWFNMLKIYALINMLVSFLLLNDFSFAMLALAD